MGFACAQLFRQPLQHEDLQLFSELFDFQPHALVNFVGAGGKTILIHALMEEYRSQGPVLYTTTTRIHPPDPAEGLVVIACDNLPLLQTLVAQVSRNCPRRGYKLVVTRQYMSPNLLRGVPPDFSSALEGCRFPIHLNEADGAASYSIKLPRDGEPVLMEGAQYLVPVIGLDCLDQPLGPEVVFRFKMLADHFSLRAGERITPEIAAGILMHKEGVCKHWQPETAIIPFINKVDGPEHDTAAKALADAILRNTAFPVRRVAFGSVMHGRGDLISVSQLR
jgi:probable selenium-dependent hydroxylase accessory protein YqeC